jgi:hypothetical protein
MYSWRKLSPHYVQSTGLSSAKGPVVTTEVFQYFILPPGKDWNDTSVK